MGNIPSPTHFFLFLFFFLLPPPATTAISFNYTTFDPPDLDCSEGAHKICLQGDATPSSGAIRLTNSSGSTGYAVYSEPLPLYLTAGATSPELTNFATTFHLNLTKTPSNCTAVLADGIAFFLSHYPHAIPPSSDGGALGLLDRADLYNATIDGAFVAVEIDTYPNSHWDPPYAHVGIDVNSIRSVAVGNLTRLAARAANKLDIVARVRVEYDSAARNLTATVEGDGAVHVRVSHHIDLSTVLPPLVAIGIASTSGYCPEYHRITSWSFSSTWDPVVARNKSNSGKLVVVAIVAVAVVIAVLAGMLWIGAVRRRRAGLWKNASRGDQEGVATTFNRMFEDAGGPRRLDYEDLVAATDGFDQRRKLGSGGSGSVYRGFLRGELNREVAVKRVSSESRRGRKEYMAEVRIISRLRHRHLVQLVGWCHQRGELLLVYELMPNLSLDRHLFGDGGVHLGWPVRYGMAVGVASALLYLHEEGDQCVVHRDVKSSNIMLDEAFRAKLGDFGLARLTEHGSGLQTTILGGTLGYMAPECFHTGRTSTESDVYAFGVVALEIATGRRAIEEGREARLVQWVWDLHATDGVLEAADGRLGSEFDRRQMEQLLIVGLWCVHPDADCRPSMRKVMAALNLEDVKIELPKRMPVPVYAVPDLEGKLTPVDSLDTFSSLGDYTVHEDGR